MASNWNKLDNAAKIFPSAYHKTDTQVFRFSCTLRETVDGAALQQAVDDALETFELFRVTMRRGLFWYYLESTSQQPVVREEYKPPCTELYHTNPKGLLFEVTYFGCRVNLEVYHVLSDGTGAMNFLKAIITRYLSIVKNIPEPPFDYDASRSQMSDDSFDRYYSEEKDGAKEKHGRSARLRGFKYPDDILRLITGIAGTGEVLALSHSHGATLTIYLCALLMQSVAANISVREKKRPVVICVPVNCRRFFPSESARNFFCTISVEYNFSSRSGELDDIIAKVSEDFRRCLTEDYLRARLNANQQLERNVFAKITPLPLKDIALKYAYRLSQRKTTASLSNVGKVVMPPELEPYIEDFGVWYGASAIQVCTCTFRDRLCVGFTTPHMSSDVERTFFRALSAENVSITVSTNLSDHGGGFNSGEERDGAK